MYVCLNLEPKCLRKTISKDWIAIKIQEGNVVEPLTVKTREKHVISHPTFFFSHMPKKNDTNYFFLHKK